MTLWRHLRLVRSCALPAKTRLYLHDYPRGVHVVGTLEMQPHLENRRRVVLRNDMFHPESPQVSYISNRRQDSVRFAGPREAELGRSRPWS